MSKGVASLNANELKKLRAMAKAAEDYEDNVLGLKPPKEPKSIADMVEQKMFERKLTQAGLAAQLDIGASKLSEILNGKRKPDVPFLKALYKKLNVYPGFLLDHV